MNAAKLALVAKRHKDDGALRASMKEATDLKAALDEHAIEETQRHVVEALGLDRSSLWELAEDGRGMVLTHCWQRPGWPSLPPDFATEGKLPWAFAKVTAGETFLFTSLDELLPEAARDVETFRTHGPKSNVTIPLVARGQAFGALAFATLGAERTTGLGMGLSICRRIIGNHAGHIEARNQDGGGASVSFSLPAGRG